MRRIRDGKKGGGGMEVGEEGDYIVGEEGDYITEL